MCAMYAFMRYCDDLSDDEGAPTARPSTQWRADLDRALAGQCRRASAMARFHDAVERYKIPHQYFFHMIDGVSSDLEPRRIQTFDELYDYCYHVASVVGLTIIHIFGFECPTRWSWPRNAASRFSSPTFCATCARIRRTAASIFRPRTSRASARISRTRRPDSCA